MPEFIKEIKTSTINIPLIIRNSLKLENFKGHFATEAKGIYWIGFYVMPGGPYNDDQSKTQVARKDSSRSPSTWFSSPCQHV